MPEPIIERPSSRLRTWATWCDDMADSLETLSAELAYLAGHLDGLTIQPRELLNDGLPPSPESVKKDSI